MQKFPAFYIWFSIGSLKYRSLIIYLYFKDADLAKIFLGTIAMFFTSSYGGDRHLGCP
jgi:hypothetical protein